MTESRHIFGVKRSFELYKNHMTNVQRGQCAAGHLLRKFYALLHTTLLINLVLYLVDIVKFRLMKLSDYESIISLWQNSEGVKVRDADSKIGINKYLSRNPGLSFVAEINSEIVGTIMAGHDGKRGYIQHLAVAINHRNKGVATELVNLCLSALNLEDIIKSHIHVLYSNELAKNYWHNRGWVKRTDIEVFSFVNGGNENT